MHIGATAFALACTVVCAAAVRAASLAHSTTAAAVAGAASPRPPLARPSALANNPANEARLDKTVRFLQEAQNSNGGFGGQAGEESSQLFSAWVALALAAAAINPQDQAKPDGVSVYTYLAAHVAQAIRAELCGPTICTTAFERELLVVDASGTSPHAFGGIDLVSELLARKLPDGSFPFVPGGHGEVNDTVFAILALSPIDEPAVQEDVTHAAKWVIEQQNSDGSWSWQKKGDEGEADTTGAAIEALNAAGVHGSEAQREAIKYLHGMQQSDGGFPEFAGEGEANSGSTAWVVQGIWAAGENPEEWKTSSGQEPLDYLESMQQPDGHIRYRAGEELNGVWMTAYTAPAYAGQPLPIPAPPRNPQPSTPTNSSGQGGEGDQPAAGVLAGGGGDGAPLFSRPQPRSKGHTPGGARLLHRKRTNAAEESARRHASRHRRNPGPPSKTPVPTIADTGLERHSKGGDDRSREGAGAVTLTGASAGRRGDGAGERAVKGVLIGAADDTSAQGAPGLRGAGAGRHHTQWLTIAIAGALLMSFLLGAQLQLRRPQAVL